MSIDRQADYHSERTGVAAALAAYIFWGLAPIYFKWIETVEPLEIIAHRILWSVPFLAGFLLLRDGAGFGCPCERSPCWPSAASWWRATG